MSKKKLGRKFNVGDKVVLTKAGKKGDFFADEFNEGDTAEVLEINEVDSSIEIVKITSGEEIGSIQYNRSDARTNGWFEHASDKKKRKKKEKQRKYFRMGDFVALKDGVNPGEVLEYGDMPLDAVGVVCGYGEEVYGNGDDVSVEVHYGSSVTEYARVHPEALRLATKEERKALRKRKVAKITYDDVDGEVSEKEVAKVMPAEYDVKVGDIVEVTEDFNGYPVGTIGEVTLVSKDPVGSHNRVKVRGNDGNWWNERNVKLVYRKENDGDNA